MSYICNNIFPVAYVHVYYLKLYYILSLFSINISFPAMFYKANTLYLRINELNIINVNSLHWVIFPSFMSPNAPIIGLRTLLFICLIYKVKFIATA